MLEALAALIPSIGVGLLFWYVIRAIVSGDRRERAAMAALDEAERRRGTPPSSTAQDSGAKS